MPKLSSPKSTVAMCHVESNYIYLEVVRVSLMKLIPIFSLQNKFTSIRNVEEIGIEALKNIVVNDRP